MKTKTTRIRRLRIILTLLLTSLFVFAVSETGFSKAKYFIPNIEFQIDTTLNSDNDFQVYLWMMESKTPKSFTSYVKIFVSDSVQIDMRKPTLLTNNGMMSFDALDIWRMPDTVLKKDHVLHVFGFDTEEAQNAKITLEAGVYLFQIIYFYEIHPFTKAETKSPMVSLGLIQYDDEQVIINRSKFTKSPVKKLEHAIPPEGSQIR